MTDSERLMAIQARYDQLRASQSKPGMNTASKRQRADLRHRVESELARQDVPWLLAFITAHNIG